MYNTGIWMRTQDLNISLSSPKLNHILILQFLCKVTLYVPDYGFAYEDISYSLDIPMPKVNTLLHYKNVLKIMRYTSVSYGSTCDESHTSLLLSLISSSFRDQWRAWQGLLLLGQLYFTLKLSIDAEIESKDASTHVSREKSTRNELAFISFNS